MLNKVNLLSKYPKTKGRDQIANERLKLTDAEKKYRGNLVTNILMDQESLVLVVTIIIKIFH